MLGLLHKNETTFLRLSPEVEENTSTKQSLMLLSLTNFY